MPETKTGGMWRLPTIHSLLFDVSQAHNFIGSLELKAISCHSTPTTASNLSHQYIISSAPDNHIHYCPLRTSALAIFLPNQAVASKWTRTTNTEPLPWHHLLQDTWAQTIPLILLHSSSASLHLLCPLHSLMLPGSSIGQHIDNSVSLVLPYTSSGSRQRWQ